MAGNEDNFINQYLNSISKQIEGWFHPLDMVFIYLLDAFQKVAKVHGNICEVGVYKGKSLVLLSKLSRPGEKIFAIDLFLKERLAETKSNLQKFAPENDDIFFLSVDTADCTEENVRESVEGPLRILHIDAGHEYHEVLHSLYLFAPLLHDNGVLIMDDYQDPEFPGVEAAVLDFCEASIPRRIVPFLLGGNKAFLATQSVARSYQHFVASHDYNKNKMRLCRIRDFDLLIGQSRTPVGTQLLLDQMSETKAYESYSVDMESLAASAKKYSQRWSVGGI